MNVISNDIEFIVPTFACIGINHTNTNAAIRSKFNVDQDSLIGLYKSFKIIGIEQILILSTCNRFEIYTLADLKNVKQVVSDYFEEPEEFINQAYAHHGEIAFENFFKVASGLDSKIIGDYEIAGQIKRSAKLSKSQETLGSFLEHLVNNALRVSKRIKNETNISNGTVSTSFLAAQKLGEFVNQSQKNVNVVLVGAGDIAARIVTHVKRLRIAGAQVTIINRTDKKAIQLASNKQVLARPWANRAQLFREANVILFAIGGTDQFLDLSSAPKTLKLVLDLSNSPKVAQHPQSKVHYMGLETLSKLVQAMIDGRQSDLPKAQEILAEESQKYLAKLREDQLSNKFMNRLKDQLKSIEEIDQDQKELDHQEVLNKAATKLQPGETKACWQLEIINEYFEPNLN